MNTLSAEDLSRILVASAEKDRLVAAANVAIFEAKLAEARAESIHLEIIRRYGLRKGDAYDETGAITRASG